MEIFKQIYVQKMKEAGLISHQSDSTLEEESANCYQILKSRLQRRPSEKEWSNYLEKIINESLKLNHSKIV